MCIRDRVGILKRIVVIDVDGEHPHILINPEILETVSYTHLDVYKRQELRGASAVIEKDLVSGKLAELLHADELMILTSVEHVAVGYHTEHPSPLSKITAAEAEQYIAEGQFEPGTMLPKIEAAVEFLKKGGKRAVITSIDEAKAGYLGRTGTVIE